MPFGIAEYTTKIGSLGGIAPIKTQNRVVEMKPSTVRYSFTNTDLVSVRPFVLRGKSAAILNQLVLAGPKGITPLELQTWTTRMANMITDYRNKYGLDIETVMEPNTGRFGGTHGRYILRSNVIVRDLMREAA